MNVLVLLLNVLMLAFFVRAILSWFPIGLDSPIRPVADGLFRITEPILSPIRRILPPLGGFDLSIIVAILGIRILLIPLAERLL